MPDGGMGVEYDSLARSAMWRGWARRVSRITEKDPWIPPSSHSRLRLDGDRRLWTPPSQR
ncbi:hypothetical protein CH63R_02061 [Colletotrichum higginsianum IMI 349063]|uniref:Uncharacterized protein n=1 Tax=Colletotrichum higginsianum (strain IMI 349063) TaxID=759273 RepID=A0A1B7YMN7_COLHI|nr:hypothetical protein CH63R_02061 [Colletotrichum higginsianum IMI 349063]OBR13335.1 hypothetical protein CH63R_02061 [Colletotrichum higginsianum IMI 349063]